MANKPAVMPSSFEVDVEVDDVFERSSSADPSVRTTRGAGPAYPDTPRSILRVTPPGLDGVTIVAYTCTLSQLIVVARVPSVVSVSDISVTSSGIDSSVESLA